MPTARKTATKPAKKTAPKRAPARAAAAPAEPIPAGPPAKRTAPEVIAELKSLGTDQNIKAYRRQGAIDPLFGVSIASIESLAKQIRADHPLACALWETRNFDAQTLATRIADPQSLTPGQLDRWSRSVTSYPISDALAALAAQTKYARECVRKWTSSPSEYIRRCGYTTFAIMLKGGEDVDDAYLTDTLARIEKEIHQSPNRAKEAMNAAVVAIGSSRKSMHAAALAAAKRIGKVEVNHGESDAKDFDAVKELQKKRK